MRFAALALLPLPALAGESELMQAARAPCAEIEGLRALASGRAEIPPRDEVMASLAIQAETLPELVSELQGIILAGPPEGGDRALGVAILGVRACANEMRLALFHDSARFVPPPVLPGESAGEALERARLRARVDWLWGEVFALADAAMRVFGEAPD